MASSETPPPRSTVRWAVLGVAAVAVVALFLWGPSGGSNGTAAPTGGPKATPVSVATVEVGTLAEREAYPGELVADAADVASTVAGPLEQVTVRLGDRVEAGQLLARVDTAALGRQRAEAQAQVRAAEAAVKRAQVQNEAADRELVRARELLESGLIGEKQFDDQLSETQSLAAAGQVAAAQRAEALARVKVLDQRLADGRLRAPFSGVVSARFHDPGDFLPAGEAVVRIVAREPLRVRFEVPEGDVGDFGESATFSITAPPTGKKAFTGTVTGTSAEVDPQRRIVRVEGIVEDAPASWLPGMYAEVSTVRKQLDSATIVPATAIVSRLQEGNQVVTGVLRLEGKTARWVAATVLARDGDRVAIEAELSPDDQVLVSGHTDLSDGAPVLVAGEAGE